MSIITQALKKAQREQSFHQAPSVMPRAATPVLVSPRVQRPWPAIAIGSIVLLGVGTCLYLWLLPRPSVSRAMLASTSLQPPSPINSPVDEPARQSLTSPPPQVVLKPLGNFPQPTTDKPILEAALETVPSLAPVAPDVSQPMAAVVQEPPALTSPSASQAIIDSPAYQQAKKRFNEALEALESQDIPQAEQLLLQAIALNSEMKAAYTSLGNLYYERQDYARAIAMYKHTLSIDPKDIKARNNLGSSYMQLAMHEEAIAELHKAIDMDNTSGLAYYNLACAYARTGAKVRAIEYLQQAIERVPQARDWALADRDFAAVKSAPAFHKLLGPSS